MYCHFPFLFAYNKCSADEVHNPSGARVEGFGEVDDLHLILDTLSLEQTNEGCRSLFNQQGCLKVCMHVRGSWWCFDQQQAWAQTCTNHPIQRAFGWHDGSARYVRFKDHRDALRCIEALTPSDPEEANWMWGCEDMLILLLLRFSHIMSKYVYKVHRLEGPWKRS